MNEEKAARESYTNLKNYYENNQEDNLAIELAYTNALEELSNLLEAYEEKKMANLEKFKS